MTNPVWEAVIIRLLAKLKAYTQVYLRNTCIAPSSMKPWTYCIRLEVLPAIKDLDTWIELGEADTWLEAGEETNLLVFWELQVNVLLNPKGINILLPDPIAGNRPVLGRMC